MSTPEEAERIVKEVTEYYGYLDHDMMDDIGRFNSDYRRRIDENWLKMENAASHSIKVLARNIYGSGARFVFELLQNAEDNSFRKADDKNDPPFISFQIHPKHIVVECNEDGFTSLDLKAICSVGESTKTAKHGYVGAKGIGFKSVFIAASRVHIQSGNYSFEFRHNRNDPGLGMVRPIWVKPTEMIPSPLTRTTLYLHDQGDEDEIEHLKTVIAMQFDDLQETCLLFLRKLSKISVTFYDGQGNLQRSKHFTKKKIDDFRVSLETTVASADISSMTSQMYHITKQLATGLAQSESRDAATEEARQSLTSAEVVLAFPLKSDYQPHISTRRQELFAFLPLRTSDYKFHIQSDFDTNANRQDIVTTTRRNLNIRDWIAKTFLQAILEFNQHPVLCYNWPLFLPSQDGGHDSFWSGLDAKILSLVQDNPILRSRNRSDLRLVREVMIASNGMVDDEGILLLDDPVEDPFISAKYPYKVTNHLKPYGLRVASVGLFVLLLKRDLSQHDSKMRANTTADDWHSSVARLCSKICNNGWNGTTLLKSLEVLPLRNSDWTAPTSGPVFFPMTGDIEIPEDLGLKVLSKSATTNPDRRDFFRHLGAAEATFEEVRSMIFSSFVQGSELYLKCSEHTIYMPDDQHPFSPASLLKDTRVPTDFDVHFLWLGYFTIAHEDQKKKTIVFRKWLCDFIGIQERLTILSPNKKELSQPFQEFFDSDEGVFILAPYTEESSAWTELDNCVWDAPYDLESVYSLKSGYKRRGLSDEDIGNIENLFLGTLGIHNISAEGIVSELECRRWSCGDEECDGEMLSLYKYLHEELTVTPGVRAAFEQSPLIFLRQDDGPKWYKTSDCLWSSTAPIRGKVTLDEIYEDLKELFVAKLGVKSLTMQMVYDELRQSPESSVEDIKVALFSFNDFLQIEDGNWDPEPIRAAKVFPVVYPDGTTALRSMDVGFAIADRGNLRSKFSDQIALLDFELEDVRHGKNSSFRGFEIADIITQKRLRPQSLSNMPVEGISSVLRLSQNGRQYEARLSTASEHIDEPAGSLTIYVPRNRREQEICFGSVLPRKFAAWLMRNPHTNIDGNVEVDIINALTSIFASDRAVLDEILDDQGMIQLQFEDPVKHLNEDETGDEKAEDNYASDSTPEPGYEVSDLVPTPTHSSMNSIIPSPVRDSEIGDGTLKTEEEVVEIQSRTSQQVRRGDESASRPLRYHSPDGRPFGSERLENQRPIPSYPASQANEDQRYLTILERVIAAARLANFPSGGAFDLNGLRDALLDSGEQSTYLSYNGLDVLSRFQSTSQLERDKKIGAAGELYVFELLSKLELPGWGHNNWQSTIRTYANIHPEYADLSHWPNRETADLVYPDTQGDLTRILVDAEILSNDWSTRRPRYYIEVKTTTGPCGTPFYMSGNQYRLVERIHHSSDFSEVYIIFRVYFLLDRSQISYRVYPDPKQLQNDGQLIFTGTTCAQEAEEIIRSLNGDIKLGKHVEYSAKRLLSEIIRYANSRSFTKVLAASEIPAITFRMHDCDRIVIEYNDDGLTKADLEAICQPVTEEKTGEYNFRTIVIANRKVHIQSGNFSFDFQHNILDPEDSIMRPVWVSPTETVPNNMTRITLYLHDQGSKEEVENLRDTIHSQFDKLHDATLVFLKDIKWMSIEFLNSAGLVIRSKVFEKGNIGKHGVCIDLTDADQRTESQLYHVTDYSVDSSAMSVTLAFPLTDDFTPQVDSVEAMQLFNLVPLRASPLAPLFLTPISEEADPFWSALDSDIRSWISQNPVLRCKGSRPWRLISHLTRVPPEAQDENGKPLLDDPSGDSYLLHKYPAAAAAKLTEYGLATLTDTRLLELLEMDLESPKPRMHTSTSRDWQIAMSRLLSKLLTNDEQLDKLKSLPIVQLRDGSWASPASGPLYFPTSGNSSIPESLEFRDVTLLATFQPERRTSYEKLGVTEPTVKEVRQKILDTFKSAESLPFGDVYEYLRYLYLTHQSFNLSSPHEQPYGDVRVLTTGLKLQNPHTTTVYYPGIDDPYSPESLLGPVSIANFLHPKIWNDGADKPGPSHPTWKVWLCDSIGIRERPSLLQAKAQSESEPINVGSSTGTDDRLLGFIERLWIHEGHELLKHPPLVSEIRQLPAQKLCGVDFEKARALELFNDGGVLYAEANKARWLNSSRCLWFGPTGLVSKRSIKRFYIEKTCDKKQLQSIARLFVDELKIRDANDEDIAEELCKLRLRESKNIPGVHRIYTYLDGKTISPETRRKFHELPLILVKQGGHTEWLRASQCFWSETDTDDLNGNLQSCYPDLKVFFLEKLGVKLSAYDELLNTTSDNPENIKGIIRSFAGDVGESISKFLAEPIRQAKIFPVRNPSGDVSLVSLDTDFAIADRQGLRRDLQDHIKLLDFDLKDVRWLWRFFQWLKIEDRYLSRCVKRSVTVSEDGTPSEEGDPWDLRHKAYHITRIAATFEVFAKYDDAASLYERLKALRVVEVSHISCALEITQDQKAIRSTPQSVTTHISDDDLNFTVYVAKDKKKKMFSDLPRILEEWLRKDRDRCHTFEVISSLTSIVASDISVVDEILEDQGIIELIFESNDTSGTKMAS
ncbi:hypothetical protein FMEXI_12426 [Fusarium mexicanum]|uniref:Protein NO VEIN C-terminal domain-containing protein n=1 Tax=Fusarium mexicanum TaxID=751941 RepID=A0A8H5IA48_9HYPO|nr:hypothetical protein FMEXI_12426 [Fusarium mexicanum]